MIKPSIQFALFIALGIFSLHPARAADLKTNNSFEATISAIPTDVQGEMQKYTWHPGCPVSLEDLAYLKLSYWGFDHQTHTGTLIVNKRLAEEAVNIFHELYNDHFPIERMEPMEAFKGNDEAATNANNTYGFNCSPTTDNTENYSLHSYGYAINVNTLINPYVKGNEVLPPKGHAYLNRSKPVPGMIIQGDKTYQVFTKYGWTWGGAWPDLQFYSHFEKDCNTPNLCRSKSKTNGVKA
jgi:D-alanyl-D-alanine carboxypeptidase-like protein